MVLYAQIPRIPANMRRDVERFWACLREGISDDEFIDEQYVKHGTCCKVRNRREYYNRCLDLSSEVVRQGSTDELMDVLRNGEEGGLIPGQEYDTAKLERVVRAAYGPSACADVKAIEGFTIGYLNEINILYSLNYKRLMNITLEPKLSTPMRVVLEDFPAPVAAAGNAA